MATLIAGLHEEKRQLEEQAENGGSITRSGGSGKLDSKKLPKDEGAYRNPSSLGPIRKVKVKPDGTWD